MPTAHPTERIIQAVQAKIDALAAPTIISHWRFAIGAAEGAQAPAFPADGWQTVTLPHTWSSLDGEAWFRADVNLPDAVETVSLAGSRLELDIMLPIGAVIYVNGEEKFREPSWADSRAVSLTLVEDYHPGAPLNLAVRCNAGDGFGLFLQGNLRLSALDHAIFGLDLARAQMTFTHFLAERSQDAGLAAAWQRAAEALDLAALADNRWQQWQKGLDAARAALAPFAEIAKSYTAHLIAHSHIDMNWLWPWRETVDVCRRDFKAMDHLLQVYPEFHFSQSQAAVYQAVETAAPPLFETARARVAEGRWDVTASTWVEGDLNMAAGETIARHFLHTRRYIGKTLGVEPVICWEPDTFGHPASVPQLLRKAGVQFYYFCRAGKRHPLFWWEGIDGSRVLAVQDLRGYGGVVAPNDVAGSVMDFAGPYGIHHGIFVYGVGDHGGGATARDIEAARAIDAAPYLPHATPDATVGFYRQAAAETPDVPVVHGELNTVFEGCYTSHGDIKRLNRDCENALLSAETLTTLANLWAGADGKGEDLAEAWRTLCFHQFHDILCGCAIGVTYREARERLEQVLATAAGATARAMGTLAASMDTAPGDGPALVVFNPLAWERTDVVRVPLARFGAAVPAALIDDRGRRLPVQTAGDELLFVAEDLPALGARIYRLRDEPLPEDETAVKATAADNTLDNGLLSLRVHPGSGALDRLVDHAAGRDFAGPWGGWGPEAKVNAGMLNRLQIFWEQPHPMSAWNLGDITRVDSLIDGAEVKVVEQGPVRGVVEVRRRFLHSSLVQRIVLYRGLRRIDFETEVDWHERGSAHEDAPMLRATCTPYFGHARAAFEIPFAGLERPADGREVPALRWADLSEEPMPDRSTSSGLSLLNDGKYGHQAHGNTLGLTLVRASYEPDNNPDEGLHRFTYSLYPHAGGWVEAGTTQRAAELNQPLLVTLAEGHPGRLHAGQSSLECTPGTVLVSALKPAEDGVEGGQAIVVRVYETAGRATDAVLRLAKPIVRAEETDLIERPETSLVVDDAGLHVSLGPYEIKTVKLYTAAG